MMNVTLGLVGRVGSGKDTAGDLIIKRLRQMRVIKLQKNSFATPLKNFVEGVFSIDKKYLYDQQFKEQVIEFSIKECKFKRDFRYYINDIIELLTPTDNFYESVYEEIMDANGYDYDLKSSHEKLFDIFLDVLKDQIVTKWWQKFGICKDTIYFKTSGRVLCQLIGTEFFREKVRKSVWVEIAEFDNRVFCDVRFNEEAKAISQRHNGFLIRIMNENQTVNSAHSTHDSEKQSDGIECDYTLINPGNSLEVLKKRIDDLLITMGFVK